MDWSCRSPWVWVLGLGIWDSEFEGRELQILQRSSPNRSTQGVVSFRVQSSEIRGREVDLVRPGGRIE